MIGDLKTAEKLKIKMENKEQLLANFLAFKDIPFGEFKTIITTPKAMEFYAKNTPIDQLQDMFVSAGFKKPETINEASNILKKIYNQLQEVSDTDYSGAYKSDREAREMENMLKRIREEEEQDEEELSDEEDSGGFFDENTKDSSDLEKALKKLDESISNGTENENPQTLDEILGKNKTQNNNQEGNESQNQNKQQEGSEKEGQEGNQENNQDSKESQDQNNNEGDGQGESQENKENQNQNNSEGDGQGEGEEDDEDQNQNENKGDGQGGGQGDKESQDQNNNEGDGQGEGEEDDESEQKKKKEGENKEEGQGEKDKEDNKESDQNKDNQEKQKDKEKKKREKQNNSLEREIQLCSDEIKSLNEQKEMLNFISTKSQEQEDRISEINATIDDLEMQIANMLGAINADLVLGNDVQFPLNNLPLYIKKNIPELTDKINEGVLERLENPDYQFKYKIEDKIRRDKLITDRVMEDVTYFALNKLQKENLLKKLYLTASDISEIVFDMPLEKEVPEKIIVKSTIEGDFVAIDDAIGIDTFIYQINNLEKNIEVANKESNIRLIFETIKNELFNKFII